MSKILTDKLNSKLNSSYSDVDYSTLITQICDIHGVYQKTVRTILYKNASCPECTKIAKNKKLSEIGKTKVGHLNNFYGHTHSEETKQKFRKPHTDVQKQKISNKVKSAECQKRIKQTKLNKYGNINYVNPDKMTKTKQKLLHQYEIDNNCTLLVSLIDKYGSKWRNANIVDTIIYKAYAFVKNEDIQKIIEYTSKITPHSGMSHKEKDLVNFIKSFYNGQILENKRSIIYPNELDIYLPELKVAIEFNGNFWHSIENGCNKEYHLKKSLLCKDKGIRLIHIYEFEDIDIQKQLLKSFILGIDKYPKDDFNKNNFLDTIPKLYKNKTEKGTIYSIGKIKEAIT